MHPLLPQEWTSRALRVAMSEADWQALEDLVRRVAPDQPTQARALGATLSYLLHNTPEARPEPGPLDWLDWERRKTLRLLLHSKATHS
ncbi:hypothetical protein BH23PLA1_BH23PLA1_10450 [soil metagenome]